MRIRIAFGSGLASAAVWALAGAIENRPATHASSIAATHLRTV
jgi:hypothetical protein